MNNRTVIIYGDELYHHGILGMKWGRRQGPPYPLDPEDHSASERKAGWRKSLADTAKKVGARIKREASDRLEYKSYKAKKELDPNKNNKRERYPFDEKTSSHTPWNEKTKSDEDRDEYQKWKKDKYKNYKKAKKDYRSEAAKEYLKARNKSNDLYDKSDELFRSAREQYKSLGKTPIKRMIEVAKAQSGKGSKAAKEYLKKWDEASSIGDKAYDLDQIANSLYKETGSNYISRVFNVAKTDINSRK